jgi:hypothetical protein
MCENDLLSCHIHTHIILAERETDLGNQRYNNNKKSTLLSYYSRHDVGGKKGTTNAVRNHLEESTEESIHNIVQCWQKSETKEYL